jgi:hypothetical protein
LVARRRLRKAGLDSKVKIIFLSHLAEASVVGSGLVIYGAVGEIKGKGVAGEGEGEGAFEGG